jgi:hypothetical protein
LADIPKGAWIAVVAHSHFGFMLAPTGTVAAIDRARVLIIAIHSLADTDTFFAMVRHRTGIAIKALSLE